MKAVLRILICIALLSLSAIAAPKAHLITLGKWTVISLRSPDQIRDGGKSRDIKIRPLYVDGRTKEFTIGLPHDVTDRTFVIQQIYKLNDSLPQEPGPTKWRWQLGGWLLVDLATSKNQPVALPDFDPDFSNVAWFRDYAAYCGTSDEISGNLPKVFVLIVQIGRRKPLLKKAFPHASDSALTCASPVWERNPVSVTFDLNGTQKLTFTVKGQAGNAGSGAASEGEEENNESDAN